MPTKTRPDDKNAADQDNEKSSQEKQDSNDATSPPSRLPSVPFAAPWWLRALFVAAGVAALIYGLLRYGLTLLNALRDLLASLFSGLFIQQPKKRTKAPDPAPNEQAPPPRPFASFANPFDTGLDQRFSPNDLVIYSFEALEAWASEHKLGRSPEETPSEFVRRLGDARANSPRLDAPGGVFRDDRLWTERLPSGGTATAAAVLAGVQGSPV